MKIIRLQVSGIKRLVAADITPAPGMNRVGGFNGEGKTSLLDSIAMAMGGADEIPMKPLRTGEEYGAIRIKAGTADEAELIVTRYFNDDGTTSLKVTNGDGATYEKGQTKLSGIIGAISFDPLRFADMEPKAQAAELRRLVPLKVDLDKLASADKADVAARRDVNRDGKALRARIDGINVSGIIPPRPDRDAILSALASAGDTNAAIERERNARERRKAAIERRKSDASVTRETAADRREAAALALKQAEELEADALAAENEAEADEEGLLSLAALNEPVDTAKLSTDLAAADRDLALLARVDERKRLEADFEALRIKSEGYSAAIEDRAKARAEALSSATMPVEGLSFATINDEMVVTFNGEPFAQSSRAEQIRVSMRIAMAANPKLRVMTIRDGSLLDERGFKLISEIAAEGDYQVFVEVVGEGEENGIIIEDGRVKGAPEPERVEPPKRRKAKVEAAETTPAADDPLPRTAGHIVEEEAAPKPKPRAMREFSSKPAGAPSDLFGKD